MTDVRHLSWRVRLFENAHDLVHAASQSSYLTGVNATGDELYIDQSVILRNVGVIPSVFVGRRAFDAGELVTMYTGTLVGMNTQAVQRSDHVIQAFGRPGKAIDGVTSRANLAGKGAASLINDASIDLAESLRQSSDMGHAVIVRRPGARNSANVEFVALVVESEYMAVRHGLATAMPSARIGVVALDYLNEGTELTTDYGDAYWRKFLEHHIRRGTPSLAAAMGEVPAVQRTPAERMHILRVAAGIGGDDLLE